jgi:hypothetical protein
MNEKLSSSMLCGPGDKDTRPAHELLHHRKPNPNLGREWKQLDRIDHAIHLRILVDPYHQPRGTIRVARWVTVGVSLITLPQDASGLLCRARRKIRDLIWQDK